MSKKVKELILESAKILNLAIMELQEGDNQEVELSEELDTVYILLIEKFKQLSGQRLVSGNIGKMPDNVNYFNITGETW